MKIIRLITQRFKSSNVALRNTNIKFTPEETVLLNSFRQEYNYSKTKPVQWGIKRAMDYTFGFAGICIDFTNKFASFSCYQVGK